MYFDTDSAKIVELNCAFSFWLYSSNSDGFFGREFLPFLVSTYCANNHCTIGSYSTAGDLLMFLCQKRSDKSTLPTFYRNSLNVPNIFVFLTHKQVSDWKTNFFKWCTLTVSVFQMSGVLGLVLHSIAIFLLYFAHVFHRS